MQVGQFVNVVATIVDNNVMEKERLKTLHSSFLRRERDVVKAVQKGRRVGFAKISRVFVTSDLKWVQSPADLQLFYEGELKEAVDQQLERYRFFDLKHAETVEMQRECIRAALPMINRAGEGERERGYDEEDEQTHLDDLCRHAERELSRQDGVRRRAGESEALEKRVVMGEENLAVAERCGGNTFCKALYLVSQRTHLHSTLFRPE